MTVKVDYELRGFGWAVCTLEIDGQTCRAEASYLSEPLTQFLEAVNQILAGRSGEVRFRFDTEPGEYRWLLNRCPEDQLSVKILWFDELWNNLDDSEGKLLLDAECATLDFCRALAETVSELLLKHGINGYIEKWGASFPKEGYLELCKYLNVPPAIRVMEVETSVNSTARALALLSESQGGEDASE